MSEYVLEIVEGPQVGRQVQLAQQPVEIGRGTGAGIEIDGDQLVSRHHARLTPTSGGVVVEDLGSSNGTFVDGDEIHSPAVLTPGGRLAVGVSVLELRTVDQAAEGTVVRPIPAALTAMRVNQIAEAPSEPLPSTDALAADERTPDYVSPVVAGSGGGDSQLASLLDVHTKRMARTAPLAIFVVVALVVMIALSLR